MNNVPQTLASLMALVAVPRHGGGGGGRDGGGSIRRERAAPPRRLRPGAVRSGSSLAACIALLSACGGGAGGDSPRAVQPAAAALAATTLTPDASFWPDLTGGNFITTHPFRTPDGTWFVQPFTPLRSGTVGRITTSLCRDAENGGAGTVTIALARQSSFLAPAFTTTFALYPVPECAYSSSSATYYPIDIDTSASSVAVTAGEPMVLAVKVSDWTAGARLTAVAGPATDGVAKVVLADPLGTMTALTQSVVWPFKIDLIEPPWTFGGFLSPVDGLPTMNTAKAGSAIPVRFSFGEDKTLAIFTANPVASQISCDDNLPTDAIEETAASAGNSGLQYDPLTKQYSYVWKTDKTWANTCKQLVLSFKDGSVQRANFKFTK